MERPDPAGEGEGEGERRAPPGSPPRRRSLRDEEPLVTIRAHPRRFGWGIPAVFVVSIGAGLPFADRSLSLAIAIQLFLQTVGLLWLYLPVASWRKAGGEEQVGHEGEGR